MEMPSRFVNIVSLITTGNATNLAEMYRVRLSNDEIGVFEVNVSAHNASSISDLACTDDRHTAGSRS